MALQGILHHAIVAYTSKYFFRHCILDKDILSQSKQQIDFSTAICLFEESGLSWDIIQKICKIVKSDPQLRFLNKVAFVLILYLISCMIWGHSVPASLPTPLCILKVARLAKVIESWNVFSVTTAPSLAS